MTSLKIITGSRMDMNLESGWSKDEFTINQWIDYLLSLPNVIDVKCEFKNTIITFDSEEAKTWFILRWS